MAKKRLPRPNLSLTQRILDRIFSAVAWRPWLTILTAVTLAALSLWYTVENIGFLTSQKKLISADNKLVQLSEQIEQFDDLDTFVVAIESPRPALSLSFLNALTVALERDSEHFVEVFGRIDPKPLKPWALSYLDEKDLLLVRDNLAEHRTLVHKLASSPDALSLFGLINSELTSGMVKELFTGFLDDKSPRKQSEPLDLTLLIDSLKSLERCLDGKDYRSPWGTFFMGDSWDEDTEGYFWTEGKRYLLLFVTPAKAESGFGKAQESLRTLRRTIAEVQAGFPGVKAGVTGQEALNVDEMVLAMEDMSFATVLSLLGLSVLLALFWRGSRRPLFGITELLIALSFTFGLTTLVVGHLNILSVVFTPLILGLGIDYGTHWLSRYEEEILKKGVTRKEAVRTTMVQIGPGLISAGLSASLSFFPLVLTGFKGLSELGVICFMGMLMTTTTSVCVLPAITLVFDRPAKRKESAGRLSSIQPLFRITDRKAATIVVVSAVGLVLSLIAARTVDFDLNMLRLQSRGAESVIWEMKILNESKRSSMYGAVVAHSIGELERKANALKSLRSVSEVQSVASILPQDQQMKLGLIRQFKPLLPEVEAGPGTRRSYNPEDLDNILSRIGFKMLEPVDDDAGDRSRIEAQMAQVRTLAEGLHQRLASENGAKVRDALSAFDAALAKDLSDKLEILHANANRTRPMELTDLPQKIRQRFVGDNGVYLIRVFPAGDIWEPEFLGRFVADIQSVDPDAIGDPVTLYTFTKAFRDACIEAAVYAVAFIALLLLFIFRSLLFVVLAMLPLLVGTAWTMGLIGCLGIDLNLANSIFLPMIVGAGVEYAIIILQRWKQAGCVWAGVPSSTGKGVILAGLTTTVGFASLMISSHQGVHSLGLLTTIGSLCVLAAAVLLLPAVMQLLPRLSPARTPAGDLAPVPQRASRGNKCAAVDPPLRNE